MMRLVFVLLVVGLAIGAVPADAAESYDAMVARAKAGDTALDYRALREAYARSPVYQPYGGDYDEVRTAMMTAFNAQDCKKALAAADKVLAAIYIDIASHIVSGRCFELAGNAAKAAHHRAVARGFMESILASGDGKGAKTAYIVVTIAEEYDVLRTLHLQTARQSLVQDDGHTYDRHDAKSATGAPATLYFQIDRPMAWLSHSMER